MQFSEIIAGQGPADIVTHVGKMKETPDWRQLSAWAHMCAPFPFSAMREVAYRNHGLQVCGAGSACKVCCLTLVHRARVCVVPACRCSPGLEQRSGLTFRVLR